MEVTVQSSTIISLDEPSEGAQTLEIPLDVFDRFASDIHICVLYAFSPPTPSNSHMIQSLAKTLRYFPTLVGELGTATSGRPCVRIGGNKGGALVVEATVTSKLADHLPLEPTSNFTSFHPPAKWGETDDCKLFQVQLNRFTCGGLVIGVTAHHRVADGQSMSGFFVAWSQEARGLPVHSLPVYDKSWLKPRTPPRCEFQHWGYEFVPVLPHQQKEFTANIIDEEADKFVNVLLHYSSEYLFNLKSSTTDKYTSFEILLGHLWRKITMARKLDEKEYSQIRISVNCRPRLKPPVAREFFGNLVLNAYPKSNVGELVKGCAATAARIVHEAVRKIDDAYIRSFIDFGATYQHLELTPCYDAESNDLSPNLDADSWLGFRFQEVDIGGGGALCGFAPSWIPTDGTVIFLPTLRPDGGVDALVSLRKEHARVLKEIAHSFD